VGERINIGELYRSKLLLRRTSSVGEVKNDVKRILSNSGTQITHVEEVEEAIQLSAIANQGQRILREATKEARKLLRNARKKADNLEKIARKRIEIAQYKKSL